MAEQLTSSRNRPAQDRKNESSPTWLIPVGLIVLLVILYTVLPDFRNFINKAYTLLSSGDRQGFEAWVHSFGAWGPIVIFATMLLQTVLAFIPSVLIMVVCVLAYGPFLGAVLAWVGLLVAACLGYGIGRAVGPSVVDRLIGHDTEQQVEHYVKEYGIWAIVAARISPVLSTDAVSFVAGLIKMGFLRFIAATAIGTLPLTILIAFVGENISRLETTLFWVSVISVGAFLGYVIFDQLKDGAASA